MTQRLSLIVSRGLYTASFFRNLHFQGWKPLHVLPGDDVSDVNAVVEAVDVVAAAVRAHAETNYLLPVSSSPLEKPARKLSTLLKWICLLLHTHTDTQR